MSYFDIEKRRKELKLTLEQIGNFVGVSKGTVKKWESGYIENMKRDKIALLAKILKVSPLAIMGIESDDTDERTGTTPEVSPKEQNHLDRYRELNPLGQDKADEYISDLTENPKYKK